MWGMRICIGNSFSKYGLPFASIYRKNGERKGGRDIISSARKTEVWIRKVGDVDFSFLLKRVSYSALQYLINLLYLLINVQQVTGSPFGPYQMVHRII